MPYFCDYNIFEITEKDYINWQFELQDKSYNYNYLRNLHYTLVAFFDYCYKFLNLKENIARKVGNFSKK